MRALITAAVLITLAGAAHAQTYRSQCGWAERGIYACKSRIETADLVTNTACASGRRGMACDSETTQKHPPLAKPHVVLCDAEGCRAAK